MEKYASIKFRGPARDIQEILNEMHTKGFRISLNDNDEFWFPQTHLAGYNDWLHVHQLVSNAHRIDNVIIVSNVSKAFKAELSIFPEGTTKNIEIRPGDNFYKVV